MENNKKSFDQRKTTPQNKNNSKDANHFRFIQKNKSKVVILAFAFFWIVDLLTPRAPHEKNNTIQQKIIINRKPKKTEEYQNGILSRKVDNGEISFNAAISELRNIISNSSNNPIKKEYAVKEFSALYFINSEEAKSALKEVLNILAYSLCSGETDSIRNAAVDSIISVWTAANRDYTIKLDDVISLIMKNGYDCNQYYPKTLQNITWKIGCFQYFSTSYIPEMIEASKNKNPMIRQGAAQGLTCLQKYNTQETLDALILLYQDSNSSVRTYAEIGLKSLKANGVIDY